MKLEQHQTELKKNLCNTIFEYYKGLKGYNDISVEKFNGKTIITINDNILHEKRFKIVIVKELNNSDCKLLIFKEVNNVYKDITDTKEAEKLFFLFVSNNITKFGMNGYYL